MIGTNFLHNSFILCCPGSYGEFVINSLLKNIQLNKCIKHRSILPQTALNWHWTWKLLNVIRKYGNMKIGATNGIMAEIVDGDLLIVCCMQMSGKPA